MSVSQSRNAIYFAIIAMPKKSHFTILRYKTLNKTRNRREFHLYCCDHVCKVNEWFLVNSSYREMQKVFRLWRAFNGPSGHFFRDSKYLR